MFNVSQFLLRAFLALTLLVASATAAFAPDNHHHPANLYGFMQWVYLVDQSNGNLTAAQPNMWFWLQAIAYDPKTGQFYQISQLGPPQNEPAVNQSHSWRVYFALNPKSGASHIVSAGTGVGVDALCYNPADGLFYGVRQNDAGNYYCEKIQPATGKVVGLTPTFTNAHMYIDACTFDNDGHFWVIMNDNRLHEVVGQLASYDLNKGELLSNVMIDRTPDPTSAVYGPSMAFDAEKEVFYVYCPNGTRPDGQANYVFGALDMGGHFHSLNENTLWVYLSWGP
jgi:hypothetical protein